MAGKTESGRTVFLTVSAERGIATQRRHGSIGPKDSVSTRRFLLLCCCSARGSRVELVIGVNHSGGASTPPLLGHGIHPVSRDVLAVYRKSKEFPRRELPLFQD